MSHAATLRLLGVLAASLLGVAACSPGAEAPSTPAETSASALDTALQSAREAGADEAQIALIEDGDVDYADYESAIATAVSCMREHGYSVTMSPPTQKDGATYLPYEISLDEAAGQTMTAADECYTVHAAFVDQYWQLSSPDVVEFRESRDAALLPALRECLTKYDVDWAETETFDELVQKAFPEGGDPDDPINCMNEIGYADWAG